MPNTWIVTSIPEISALLAVGEALGGAVTVVAVASDGTGFVGADALVAVPAPDGVPVEALAPAVVQAVCVEPGDVVLVPNRPGERSLAGALAAALDAPVLACVRGFEDGAFVVARYGGISEEIVRPDTTMVVLLEPGTLPDAGEAVAARPMAVPAFVAMIVAREASPQASVDLVAARRVVAVGRGFKTEDDLRLARALARALEAELACSRPLAEGLGWLPRETYVGVSGLRIHPPLYVALGISGQLQHMVGVRDAATIVAVNVDEDAPVFTQADYGIVGDLYEILPELTREVS